MKKKAPNIKELVYCKDCKWSECNYGKYIYCNNSEVAKESNDCKVRAWGESLTEQIDCGDINCNNDCKYFEQRKSFWCRWFK